MYLEIVELAVPVLLEYLKLLVAYAGLLISCDDLFCFRFGLLTEEIYEFLRLTGSESDIGLESAAGVGVEVEVIVEVCGSAYGVSVAVVASDELVSVTAVLVDLLHSET